MNHGQGRVQGHRADNKLQQRRPVQSWHWLIAAYLKHSEGQMGRYQGPAAILWARPQLSERTVMVRNTRTSTGQLSGRPRHLERYIVVQRGCQRPWKCLGPSLQD